MGRECGWDSQYINRLGLLDRIDTWRELSGLPKRATLDQTEREPVPAAVIRTSAKRAIQEIQISIGFWEMLLLKFELFTRRLLPRTA